MSYLDDNNFIKRLQEGMNTRLILMTHNAYWCQLQKFEKIYNNFKVDVFGSGTAYARMRKEDVPKDCDFIILDGSDFYRDNEYIEIKKMAIKISEENNKRVSIGYVYIIPIDKRLDSNMHSEIKIASFKNGDTVEETIPISNHNLLILADMIVKTHKTLENQIVLKKDYN